MRIKDDARIAFYLDHEGKVRAGEIANEDGDKVSVWFGNEGTTIFRSQIFRIMLWSDYIDRYPLKAFQFSIGKPWKLGGEWIERIEE